MAYTCITCRVVFHEPEIQRAHYKTDWHRYNLKRKVAELPTVTADDFREKVLAQQSLAAEADNKGTKVCLVCKKQFATENSYSCHVQSKKHLEKAAMDAAKQSAPDASHGGQVLSSPSKLDEPEAETPIVVEEECDPEPLEISECLFCSKKSEDMESSLVHMSKAHGFFIPDLDYIADVKGLIGYLCEKVGVGCVCLYCNDKGKAFYSVEAVQKHMVSKSHCKIFFEDDAAFEYAEYYDYSTSYPEGHEGPECQTLAVRGEVTAHVNEDLELVLPSGVSLGHRALCYLYKQRTPTLEHRKAALVSRLLAEYRALGSREHGGGDAVKRVRDQRWYGKMCQERDMKLGVRANKLQKHFRPQMMV